MLITIYDSVGKPKVDLSPNDSSTQVKEVQGDNVLTLSFTHYEHIELDVDDYADFEGERYWLTEKYRPKQKSTKEWSYDIKLYGVESMIKRLLVIKTVDNEEEPVFTLTAPPREHVAMIVRCMNDGMGNVTDWKVGQVDGTENIVIDYFGKYCDQALKEIAEKVGAEWWVEGQTVNICKCEHGKPVELGYNKGLLSIDPGTADNVKFYTRLYPLGSSRNIDRGKYGFSRLQLPGGQKYVEINADKYGRVDHFEQSAFEGIYPRRIGSVSSVRTEVKTGEDGNPFTIYYFTDDSLPFDPNDYMIGGLVIRVSFQEGSELAGLGEEDNGTYFFEVNFNSSTREFEIITIWPYDNDVQLPGDKLVPKAGDKYILWNLRMPDEYYALAEEEFLTAVNKYNADHNLDISVYKAPTDHVWIEDNNVELSIGSRVRLESEEYFPGFGFRDSRITKITRKVNLPASMDIEISDALSRTSQEKMADSIADVRSFAQSIGASISLPDIIRTGDNTRPTDNNLLSAKRSMTEFLSKLKDDYTQHKVGSAKAFEVGRYEAGSSGGIIGIDGNGDSFAEVARLYVRVRAFFESLTVINADVLAGKQYITPGGGIVCTRVEETDTAYRCYFLSEQDGEKTETKMMAGDQAIAQMFNAKIETANKVSNHRYWRLVLAVDNDAYTDDGGNHYGCVYLSKNDCESGSDVPQPGDHICQLGHRGTDRPERQTAMVFSTVDADAPSIHMYSGINSFSLSGKSVISFGQDPDTHKVYFRLGASDAEHYFDFKDGKILFNGTLAVGSKIGDKDIDTFIGDKVEGLRQSVGVYRLVAEGEVSPVECDAAGAVTGAYPVPHVHVYRGMELLTSGVAYAVQSATGIFATVSASGAVTLSAMTADEASVVVTATVDGYTLSMKLTAYKVKPGADGAPGAAAVTYSLEAEPQVARRNFDGTVTPTSVTISQYATTGDGPRVSSNRYFIYFKREGQDGTFGYAPTAQVAVQLTAGTTAVVAELRDTAGAVLYRTTVPVLADASGMEIGGGNMLPGTNHGVRNWKAESYKGGVAKPGKMNLAVGGDGKGVRITHESEGSYDPANTTWQALFHIDPGVLEPGAEYTLSYRIRGTLAGGHYTTGINRDNFNSVQLRSSGWRYHVHDGAWHRDRLTFKTPDGTALTDGTTANAEFYRSQPLAVVFYLSPSADTPEGWWAEIGDLQLERGNVATAYKPHIHDLDYIAEALRENTTIEGGMILSSLIRLGYTEEDAFKVMSGLSGLYSASERGGGISYWAGGGCKDAADYPGEGATAAIRQDGTAYFCKNTVKFDDRRMTVGKYAVMDELGIRLLRDDGGECISLTADEYPDGPSDVYSGTAAAKTVPLTASGTETGTWVLKEVPLGPAWQETRAVELAFGGGALYGELTVQDVDELEGMTVTARVSAVLRGYSDAACTSRTYESVLDTAVIKASRGSVRGNSFNLASRRFSIPRAGYYRLYAVVTCTSGMYTSFVLKWNNLSATTLSEFYVSRYFANGFCLGSKADEYVSAWRNDNGLFFEARVPDYGIRLVPWGVQCYVNGQWTTQPKMIFRGRANRSGNGYTWGNTNPSSPTPAITVSGNTVTLTFPTAWVNTLGGKLGADGLDVTVTPAGTTPVAVAYDVKYMQALTVTMSSLTSFWIEMRVL